jgi:hypothetical protein
MPIGPEGKAECEHGGVLARPLVGADAGVVEGDQQGKQPGGHLDDTDDPGELSERIVKDLCEACGGFDGGHSSLLEHAALQLDGVPRGDDDNLVGRTRQPEQPGTAGIDEAKVRHGLGWSARTGTRLVTSRRPSSPTRGDVWR